LFGSFAAGTSFLVGRSVLRRSQQRAAAVASGLAPADDLTHLPGSLQHTALWSLADGGFERRVVRGTFARASGDIAVTAFDLETLRERRGEWAYLPLEPAFRIGGVVTVVACELPRELPHVLLKHVGHGDRLLDDDDLLSLTAGPKRARLALGVARSYPAELPATLPAAPVTAQLPAGWRAYTNAPELLAELLAGGLHAELSRMPRRDLVVELLGGLAVVYPAARDAPGPDLLADLITMSLTLTDAICASAAVTPRGVEPRRS
jgi:hypothetical protein